MNATGLLDNIKSAVFNKTGLTDEFVDEVDLILQSLNYNIQENDSFLICFCIYEVVNKIKNTCNIAEIPKALQQTVVNMVCGEFLFQKKNSGGLEGFNLNLNSPILKQIQEGDTTVGFASELTLSPEQRLDMVINFMLSRSEAQIRTFRRIKWT